MFFIGFENATLFCFPDFRTFEIEDKGPTSKIPFKQPVDGDDIEKENNDIITGKKDNHHPFRFFHHNFFIITNIKKFSFWIWSVKYCEI